MGYPYSTFYQDYPCHFIPKSFFSASNYGFNWLLTIINYYHHDHDHVVPLARTSLTLSRHFSLSFIASGRSSEIHPVSSHSCCMYVRAGHPAFAWPYAGVHRSTSLMSSSLLLQQCPECLVRLAWIVFMMGGRSYLILIIYPQLYYNSIVLVLFNHLFVHCYVVSSSPI